MSESFLEGLKICLEFLGPILVVVVTARSEWTKKKDKELEKLKAESAEKKEQELNDRFDELKAMIKAIEDRVSSVFDEIEKIQKNFDQHEQDIQEIAAMNRLNGEYTRELAQLVMTLSEGMRDQHLDGNITRAIDRYRAFEHNALSSFMTGDSEFQHHGSLTYHKSDDSKD